MPLWMTMRKIFWEILFFTSLMAAIAACSSEESSEKDKSTLKDALAGNGKSSSTSKDESTSDSRENSEDLVVLKKAGYEKVVTKKLTRSKDCINITQGTIEYRQDGETVVVIDYGDGTCDNIANKTIDGKSSEIKLDRKKRKRKGKGKGGKGWKKKLEKKITKELVKQDNCNYIVEGTVNYLKDGKVVATVDYGDGTCDDLATKTVNGESKVIKLKDRKKKGKKGRKEKYKKNVVSPLVKLENCSYIVEGTVEYLKDGKVAATLDFGDGTCDDKATKTVDGKKVEITLKQKKKRGKPEKDKSKSSEKS